MSIERADPSIVKGWYLDFHFVIQTPGLQGEEARAERIAITHADLGL